MKQNSYEQLVKKMHDVAELKPQTVGPFTPLYKQVVPFMKISPVRLYILTAAICGIVMYVLLGSAIVTVTSILQHGF